MKIGIKTVGLIENRGKFRAPAGALAYWLANGAWPVDGVVELDRAIRRTAEREGWPAQRLAATLARWS